MSQRAVVTVCEHVCAQGWKQSVTTHFAPIRSAVDAVRRLAVTLYVLGAKAGRGAWQRFVASIHVKKLGEDNGQVGKGEEVVCAT